LLIGKKVGGEKSTQGRHAEKITVGGTEKCFSGKIAKKGDRFFAGDGEISDRKKLS